MRILYCSPVEWWETRQRFHHVAHELSERHEVSVCYPRSHKRILAEQGAWRLLTPFSREREGRLQLFGIPQIPFYRAFPPLIRLNWAFASAVTESAMRQVVGEVDVLWLAHPSQASLVNRVPHRVLVYECVDDYAEFWDDARTRRDLLAAEEALARAAHVVVATSRRLVERMQPWSEHVVHVGNGVDVDWFLRALSEPFERPAEIARSRGKVVGFYGAIGSWVDQELWARAALDHPEVTFLAIGPAFTDTSVLAACPNVVLTGLKPYEDLLAYLAHVPTWILPFRQNALTVAVDPVKIYEYLAAGRRVVSTFLPDLESMEAHLSLARTSEAFLGDLERAIVEPFAPEVSSELEHLLQLRSWKHLGALLEGHVLDAAKRAAGLEKELV